MSRKIKLKSLVQDDKNFNKHTEEGTALLEKSIDTVGVIESITVSADNKIISGNARQKAMDKKFDNADAIVIETDGTQPIIIKRTDIESGTQKFHESALLANTVAKKNINLDLSMIEEVMVDEYGINIEEVGVSYLDFPQPASGNDATSASDSANDEDDDFDWGEFGDDVKDAVDGMEKGIKKSVILEYDIDEYERLEPLLTKYKKEGNLSWFLADKLREHYGN